jgi:hydrogenase-4 component B
MCAGAVYMKLHKLDLNDIRGFGRKNNFLKVIFAIGALGIMGVPLFSGYISKTLIHEGIVEYAHELTGGAHTAVKAVEYLFLLSGGMTIGYMLKLFIAVFVEKPNVIPATAKKDGKARNKAVEQESEHGHHVDFEQKWSISLLSKTALIIPAAIIVVCGVFTNIYIEHLSRYMSNITHAPEIEHIEIFSLENLKGFAISLTIGLLVYLFIRKCLMKEVNGRKIYINAWPKKLDLEDLVYRPLLLKALPALFAGIFKALIKLTELVWSALLIVGKGIGLFVSSFGEAIIYSIKKIFFKDLIENKKSPLMEKLYARFDEGDRALRIVEATISYSIIWLLLGLIGTILFLILYK